MRKICIFTSTRAEWGLLQEVATELRQAEDCELQILASGSHLSAQLGMTIDEIEAAGFQIDERVDILKFGDQPDWDLSDYGACAERLWRSLAATLSRSTRYSRRSLRVLLPRGCGSSLTDPHRTHPRRGDD